MPQFQKPAGRRGRREKMIEAASDDDRVASRMVPTAEFAR
jgi:hypothetical protein